MSSYRELLNSLYGGCSCPIPVRINGQEYLTDNLDFSDAMDGRIEVGAHTCDGVTFLVGRQKEAQRNDAENCRVQPTAALFNDGTLYLIWALDVPLALGDATTFAAAAGMEPVCSMIPLPPTDGWEILYANKDRYYTIGFLAEAYIDAADVSVEPKMSLESLGSQNDARILVPYNPSSYTQEIIVSSAARKEAASWDAKRWSIAGFINLLTEHRVGKKNGPAFVLAELVSGQRTKNAVKAIYGVGLDIDTGTPSAAIDKALINSGWLAVRYTTHSHGKIYTEVSKDRLSKFAPGQPITADLLARYLRDLEGWDPSIAETADLDGIHHTSRGVVVRILHAPMPKNRVVVFLDKAYVIADQHSTQMEAIRFWEKIPMAVAACLGVPLDKACLDPCRLFFYPRHDQAQDFEVSICGGRLVSVEELGLTPRDPDNGTSAKKGGKSTTTEGKGLGRWCARRGDGFQIRDALEAYADDRIRGRAGANVTIECPFDELHSNAGDPEDMACFVVNAGEGITPVFTISCRHESCRDKTNLDMLGKMLKDSWFDQSVLEDENFDAIVRDETGERVGLVAPVEPVGGLYIDRDQLLADLKPQVSVLLGGNQAKLIVEKGERYELLSKSDGMLWFSKYQLQIEAPSGKVKTVPGLSAYLAAPDRLEFIGLTNRPRSAYRTPPFYSTWRGFGRQPEKGDWSLLKQHIRDVICGGDKCLYVWLTSWMAQLLQRPEEKLGTAIVLRGARGCGKTTLGMALRKIIGHVHSRKVSQQHHVTGHFNSHLMDCLFLLVEEGVWGGNKSAEGILKDLITGDTAMIEAKYVGAMEMPNYTRVMITSNEKWVVPAGKAERRFLVLDVVDLFDGLPEFDHRRKAYFDALYDEMEHGGYEAMMADLLVWDFTQTNLRQPPITEGLRKQMAHTFTDEQEWLLGALIQGSFTDRTGERILGSSEWELDKPMEISTAQLLESYRAHVTTYKGSAPSIRGMLQFLGEYGDLTKKRLTTKGGDRCWGYVFGPRQAWRARFSEEYKFEFDNEGEIIDLAAYRSESDKTRSPDGAPAAPSRDKKI